jgi:signal transduction histidine kinase
MKRFSQPDLPVHHQLPTAVLEVSGDGWRAESAAEDRMRQFLADTVHELRTPLTVLRGTSEVLVRQPNLEPAEINAALRAINQEAIRISRLVDDLSHLNRLDAGYALHPQPVTLSSFLEAFIQRYVPAWPDRTLQLDCSCLGGARVRIDSEALTRMLINLVENAVRYSSSGTLIRVRAAATEHVVSLAVQDEGPGLSPDDARRVFERFYRGSTSRQRQSSGSGLGLAIVLALVRQSQGEVRLDTDPERGTTVTISLPRLRGLAP